MPTPRRNAGFTLLELMIAGVIVAILATIALPSYNRYVLRSNRAVVRGVLIDLAAKQEVRKLQYQSYASSTSALLGIGSTTDTSYYIDRSGGTSLTSTTSSIYKITLSADKLASNACVTGSSTGSFALVAATVSGSPQANDKECPTLCISSTGLRGQGTPISPIPPTPLPPCWAQ